MNNLEFSRSLAVVIGVDQYINGIAPLRTAVADANAIAHTLQQDHGYEVITLLNEQANLKTLQALIQSKLPNLTLPDSRLLLYFAGHGIAQDGDDGPAGYLIPQDAIPGETQSYLPMTTLHDALTALSCRHFLAIFDCCFAGAFRWSSTRDINFTPQVIHQERYDRFRQDPAWQVITSASYDQKAMDILSLDSDRGELKGHHSPFADALLKALKGEADAFPPAQNGQPAGDGVITATELYLYLRDSVEVLTEGQHKRQTPELCPLRNHDKGEFIFLTPGHTLNLPPAPELNRENNPYRGLESFEPENSDLFFGREQEIEQLLERLETPHPLTVILGASGTGKSSPVKAGLLPRVKEQGNFQVLPVIRPGTQPLIALARSFGEIVTESERIGLTQRLAKDEQALSTFLTKWHTANPHKKLLLIIDQTEELITQSASLTASDQFQKILKQTMATHWECLWIVATLRLDFEAQFQDEALQEEWMNARFVISPMGQAQLRDAIERPAAARVLYFEPASLVDQLIEDVAQTPGALPLLSFTLSEMYLRYLDRRSDNRALTEEDYRALGGVAGSLTQRANQEYAELVAEDKAYAQTIRHVMLRMVAVEGGELARRRVPLSELVYGDNLVSGDNKKNARVQTLLQRLVAARLIVRGQEGDSEAYVEPAHDALVRGWDKLLRWKNEEQEAIALQRRLSPTAKEWHQQRYPQISKSANLSANPLKGQSTTNTSDKQHKAKIFQRKLISLKPNLKTTKQTKQAKGLLWNDNPRLGLLKEVLSSPRNWLNQIESDFVEASTQLKRSKQRRFIGSLFGVIASLSALSFMLVQTSSERYITSERNMAERMAAEAELLVTKSSAQQRTGALLALRAYSLLQDIGEESARVNQVLRKSLTVLPKTTTFTHNGAVNAIAFSPDGTTIATASEDCFASLWSAATGTQTPQKLLNFAHKGKVNAIAFHPDGTKVITASDDKTVKVWDTKTGDELNTIEHDSRVRFISLSPPQAGTNSSVNSGRWLATLSGNKLQVFESATGKAVLAASLPSHPKHPTNVVRFSPDGNRLAAADVRGNITIWTINNQQSVFQQALGQRINAIDFSPDGNRLAIASSDGKLRVINSETGETTLSKTYDNIVRDVTFSADGQNIAIAVFDETARIIDAKTGDPLVRFNHEDEVRTVAFSPDGKHLLTTSLSASAQVWDIDSESVIDTLSHENAITAASFRPTHPVEQIPTQVGTQADTQTPKNNSLGSDQIATASKDGTAKIWGTAPRVDTRQFSHDDTVRSIDFGTADGKWIVTASRDGTVKIWDTTTEEVIQTLPMTAGAKALTLEVSRDCKRIVTVGSDRTVRLWDVEQAKYLFEHTHTEDLTAVSLHPDGTLVATASKDKKARVFNEKGEMLSALAHEGGVRSVKFNLKGNRLATASFDKKARIWDVASGTLELTLNHNHAVREAVFSPNGRYLATASDSNKAALWDLQDEIVDRENPNVLSIPTFQPRHNNWVNTVRFSPDGTLLVTGSRDRTAKVWDLEGKDTHSGGFWDVSRFWTTNNNSAPTLRNTFNHRRAVNTVRFDRRGARLVTASADGSASVWDIEKGKPIIGLTHQAEVMMASFSPDGQLIATASKDKTAKVGGTDAKEIAELVCDRVAGNPTANDWIQYMDPVDTRPEKVLLDYQLICEDFPPHPSVALYAMGLGAEGLSRPALSLFKHLAKISADDIDLAPTTAGITSRPREAAEKAQALYLISQAEEKALSGNTQAAADLYSQALEVDETADLSPSTAERNQDPEEIAQAISQQSQEAAIFSDQEIAYSENYDYWEDDFSAEEDFLEEDAFELYSDTLEDDYGFDDELENEFENEFDGEAIEEERGSESYPDNGVGNEDDYLEDDDDYLEDDYDDLEDDDDYLEDDYDDLEDDDDYLEDDDDYPEDEIVESGPETPPYVEQQPNYSEESIYEDPIYEEPIYAEPAYEEFSNEGFDENYDEE